MRRLTYDYVYDFFKENGCELLESEYKNNYTKMEFRCKCGKIDEKNFQRFTHAPNCCECGNTNSLKQLKPRYKLTHSEVREFVENNSDCLLLDEEYINNSTPLVFSCGCGEEFSTTFAKFKSRNKRQCNVCSKSAIKEKYKLSYDEVKEFIENQSNCLLLSESYENNSKKLKMLCPCGNEFYASFGKFKTNNKRQCYECGQKIKNKPFDIEVVKQRVELSGCKLLSTKYKNARESIDIECQCGESFSTSLDVFNRGKDRCDRCTSQQSKLSLLIEKILKENEVNYKMEFRFSDCRNIKPLPFDFAVLGDNGEIICLIEADGKQHFLPQELFGGEESFEEQIYRDKIKSEYCNQNNINLIRIPYFEENNIEEILTKHLIELGVFIMQ